MPLRSIVRAAGLACALTGIWAVTSNAHAAVILSATSTASASQPAPLGIKAALIGPNGPSGGLLEGSLTFATSVDAAVTITLSGLAGHGFEAILDGTDLGAGAVFSALAAAGGHVLDVWDYTLTGTPGPGGAVLASFDDAPVVVTITTAAPEPAMAAALGLVVLGLARRRA